MLDALICGVLSLRWPMADGVERVHRVGMAALDASLPGSACTGRMVYTAGLAATRTSFQGTEFGTKLALLSSLTVCALRR